MKNDRFRLGFYGDIVVSPDNPELFYALAQNLQRSDDGGRTFEHMHGLVTHLYDHPSPALHLDHHDLWIDPTDPKHMILGNDGGVYISSDRGATWLHLNNIPGRRVLCDLGGRGRSVPPSTAARRMTPRCSVRPTACRWTAYGTRGAMFGSISGAAAIPT